MYARTSKQTDTLTLELSLNSSQCYWSELNGNGTAVWSDPELTPAGLEQAFKAHKYWKSRLEEQKMPAPDSYYSSPLTRCTITANLTFNGLALPKSKPFVVIVKEFFREGISIHTCDRRSTKSFIANMFPWYKFEKGFTERDELWRGTEGETGDAQSARTKIAMDDVFQTDGGTWISISSHSGEIARILTVVGHRTFRLSTGQIIPFLVKAEVVDPIPTSTFVAFTFEPTCTSPPVTSIAGQGCVCSTAATPTITLR
jgi:broad specificity phosphatase PhoE